MHMQPATRIPGPGPAWQALSAHARSLSRVSLNELFREDDHRADRMRRQTGALTLDLSRQRLRPDSLELLLALARERNLAGWSRRLFSGEPLNHSENHPAMHWALRLPGRERDCAGVWDEVEAQRRRMREIAGQIRVGDWRGYDGQPIRDLVCLGVGGSQLGPMMVTTALSEQAGVSLHFASSMDGLQMARLLPRLDPARTLFLVASKSFTTRDTLDNARIALDWLARACPERETLLRHHFIGISAHPERMADWGLPTANQLRIWAWVGGRYSLCSAMGLPIMIAAGPEAFDQLLAGAHAMDRHFQEVPWEDNLPVLLGLTDIWNRNFLGIHARAVLPYDTRLAQLPAYLEQLEMESGGKSVDRDGDAVGCLTAPVVWGGLGMDARHAFYQFLHQGTEPVACDFLVSATPPSHEDPLLARHLARQHRRTLADCQAHARALALGSEAMPVDQHCPQRHYPGDRPSTTLVLKALDPRSLGELVALYEHKVFVQSVIWGTNPFDQWGIELGKQLAEATFRQFNETRSTRIRESGPDDPVRRTGAGL